MKTLADICREECLKERGYLNWGAAAQAVREAVIEECAKVCDTEWNGDSDTYEYSEACNECAQAIRALKDKK